MDLRQCRQAAKSVVMAPVNNTSKLPESQFGLTSDEARAQLEQFGPNALPEKPPKPLWKRLLFQFKSPLIYILLAALGIDLAIWVIESAVEVPFESLAIAVILLFNAGLGVYQEGKAEAALQKLKALAASLVWVMRDGKLEHLPATGLVPGDLVRIEAGDRIPADGDLIEAQLEQAGLPDDLERARAIWARKFGAVPENPKEWARQARFLQSRGFAPEVVRRLLKDPVAEEQ